MVTLSYNPSDTVSNFIRLNEKTVYDLLCAVTQYGNDELTRDTTIAQAAHYFETTYKSDCEKCPCVKFCPLCYYNE